MAKVSYDHKQVEEKWLETWEKSQLFQDTSNQDGKDKMYLLFAFAYPSGSGLHVGHVESKTALDILARYYRMSGKDVFFPVGWDAFGLPAENYAIKTGVPPAKTTVDAINTFRRQIKRVGISYDWSNEIATSHPEYYKWTQWLFLKLFEKGLAYKKPGMVNWCPSCQTVLANEQVVQKHKHEIQNSKSETNSKSQNSNDQIETVGVCERCDTPVVQRELEQWYFKITDYKDELIEGLDQVDWPKPTEEQQKHWIGKSEGAKVKFEIRNPKFETNSNSLNSKFLETFTTRVDTIFGVTFLVMSPEKTKEMMESGWEASDEVKDYVGRAFGKTEEERMKGEKDKTGVDTGLKAVNPVNNQEVPIFVADYVLAGYGTGVVMGVPAHDGRDHAFAKKFNLPITQVIHFKQENDYKAQSLSGYEGKLVNSGEFDGMDCREALKSIPEKFDEIEPTVIYRLRDWLISRQRYWGAPIPIVYDPDGKAHPVKEEHLPWLLPTDVEFKPTGESPLTHSKEFAARVEKLYGKGWRPEYDTMDTFVDSSWYFLRYVDSRNKDKFADEKQLSKWLPVDFYMIGPEHIVLHLLYARFLTKFLRDQGYLKFDEPFLKMRHQGMILGPDHKKMSKSKGNVIDPDVVIEEFGADTLRMYEMFMGPIEADKPWDTRSVVGVRRFLDRVSNLVRTQDTTHKLQTNDKSQISYSGLQRKLHQTIKKVSEDIPALKFNTAIAAMMELVNSLEQELKKQETRDKKQTVLSKEDVGKFVRILAPFAPFLAEEMWQSVQQKSEILNPKSETNGKSQIQNSKRLESVHLQDWPEWDEELVVEETQTVVVQVNGKVRASLEIRNSNAEIRDRKEEIIELAKNDKRLDKWLDNQTIRKEIFVPGGGGRPTMVNLVVG